MNAFGELWRAVIGWLDLLTARPGSAEKFTRTGSGLVNATGCYLAVVMLLIAVESALSGFPGWPTVALGLFANAAWLGTIWGVIWVTARVVRSPAIAMAVPSPPETESEANSRASIATPRPGNVHGRSGGSGTLCNRK